MRAPSLVQAVFSPGFSRNFVRALPPLKGSPPARLKFPRCASFFLDACLFGSEFVSDVAHICLELVCGEIGGLFLGPIGKCFLWMLHFLLQLRVVAVFGSVF